MAIETLPEPSIRSQRRCGAPRISDVLADHRGRERLLALIVAASILAPLLAPHDPLLLAPSQRLKPSSAQFLLGTDAYGRDVLSRIIYGDASRS